VRAGRFFPLRSLGAKPSRVVQGVAEGPFEVGAAVEVAAGHLEGQPGVKGAGGQSERLELGLGGKAEPQEGPLVLVREVHERKTDPFAPDKALSSERRRLVHAGRGIHATNQGTARFALFSLIVIERQALVIVRSEEHTSELQSRENLVCRLLLEKNKHHKQ